MSHLIKRINLSAVAIGLVLALGLMFSVALAQTETTPAETTAETATPVSADIPEELVLLAQDLGCQTNAECAEKFDANIEEGIALAQKHDIYTPEQERLATTFRTEVLERLRTVSQDNFEEEILALANKILSEKPALARIMSVTRQTVDAAETIVNTVKEAGVDLRTCQKSPEDLSREELIACVRASNNLSNRGTLVGDYIPKENTKAGEAQQMIDLENSLLAGEYSGLGQVGVEQAGQICLRPGSESIADCDRIAERFFGSEGLKHLQEARQQSTRIKEYYTEGIERMELVTPDGQRLIGKGAIKNACNSAFDGNNLGLARACGNFAVKNGYATQEEIEDGLKLLENFSQKATEGVNFDDCRFNPQSCREFLPDESRSQFDSQFEIFKIMSESIGFDPSRCENTYDPDIGRRCMEGAKNALSQIEEIAQNSPEARRIVNEIRSHITEGERMTQRQDEFNQDSSRGGMAGPGGCRGPEECYRYCSQPANSAECISFGAKSQIFDQNSVVQRFNIVNESNEGFDYRSFPSLPDASGQFRPVDPGFNQYPYPYPPSQPDVDPGFNRYPYPPPQQPAGPSPECFAAISSGDFARAKIACSSTTDNYPRPIAEPYPVCPAYSFPSPCPEGQMRQPASDARGCPSFGACVAIDNYKPIGTPQPCPTNTYWDGKSCVANPEQDPTKNICPMMPSVTSCPAGQEMYVSYESNTCGKYYGCRSTTTPTPCPSGQYWNGSACVTTSTTDCISGQWWDPATQSCKSSPVPTVGSCNYSTQYWKPATSQCLSRTNCTDTSNSEYNSQECQGVRGMTQPVASGCGSMTTQATCQASLGCGWANGACGGNNMMTNSCPSGQYWYTPPGGGAGYCMSSVVSGSCPAGYHSHSESGGFCMNDQENYSGTCYNSAGTSTIACPQTTYMGSCTSGQYWNGTACVTSTTSSSDMLAGCTQAGGTWNTSNNYCQMPTCPSGQYWYTPPSGGTGYCMSSTTGGCSSGQYWNGTACVTTSTTDCPSGQYWYTPPSGGTGYCMSSTSGTSCTSGQYWNGSACVTSSITNTVDMGAACALAGGTWSSSSNYCQMPTTMPTCPSGQYWNGSMCVSSSTTTPSSTSCSSGQYWDGSACVTSPTPTPTPEPTPTPAPTPDPATMCAQGGGTWTGSMCQMAESISDQKAYYSYFGKSSDALLAQVFRAFANLFR